MYSGLPISDSPIDRLNEISTWLNSVLDLDQLLELIIDSATRMMQAKASSLLLLDQKTGKLYFKIATGEKKEEVRKYEVNMGEGIAGYVAETGEPLLIPDVSKDNRHIPARFKEGSELCVPLKIKDKIIGVINADKKETNGFSITDHLLLTELASQAALAIENASLNKSILESEQKYRSVVDNIGIGISQFGYRICSVNNRLTDMNGSDNRSYITGKSK